MQSPETRASLIGRLHDPASEEEWAEFTGLYQPLIYRVARAKGLQHADAEDLSQDVMMIVRRSVSSFDPKADGSFRGWLFTITRNLCVNHLVRQRGPIGSGDSNIKKVLHEQPADEETATLFRLEHRRLRFRQAAESVKSRFAESTWQSFWLTAVEQRSIDDVAKQLGMSNGAVRVARCRVLAKIQQHVRENEDSES